MFSNLFIPRLMINPPWIRFSLNPQLKANHFFFFGLCQDVRRYHKNSNKKNKKRFFPPYSHPKWIKSKMILTYYDEVLLTWQSKCHPLLTALQCRLMCLFTDFESVRHQEVSVTAQAEGGMCQEWCCSLIQIRGGMASDPSRCIPIMKSISG